MHERALPCTSVSSWNCVLRQANINQPDYPATHVAVTYLVCVIFLLGRTSYTQRTRNDEFLGLPLYTIRRPDYTDAPYRKFLGMRYLTTRVPGYSQGRIKPAGGPCQIGRGPFQSPLPDLPIFQSRSPTPFSYQSVITHNQGRRLVINIGGAKILVTNIGGTKIF